MAYLAMKKASSVFIATTALVCLIGCGLLSTTAADSGSARMKPVTVALHTKWPQTGLLAEASEFFFDESPGLFWSFLVHVQAEVAAGRPDAPVAWTDEQQYDTAVRIGQGLLSPVKQNFLALALALRFYSARIQMYRQIVETEDIRTECEDVLVDFGAGRHVCGPEAVESALGTLGTRPAEEW